MPNSNHGTFEIGLVMAGAISAGAYTAGVCDFLIQALDAWEAAKADPNARVPRHSVKIRALAGASAGAMTSAIAAVALGSELDPVVDPAAPPPPERNRFYDAWVRQIDITRLLGTTDIGADGKVVSLLDSNPLKQIADEALVAPRRAARRAYVADPLAVMLTVANLRGVPYGFRLFGSAAERIYGMYEHMDHMRFAVSWDGRDVPCARRLAPQDAPGGAWPQLVLAALASGAFPIGLAPRLLQRPCSDFAGRHGRNPLFPPDMTDYAFLCVDGGLMDNEPLELARRYLAGSEGENPRDGERACRAVVMIDPFPNEPVFDPGFKPNERITSVAMQMFGALKNQARFKPEELELAEKEDVFSRFMVAPSRTDEAGKPVEPAMASAILGGFGGFFHESFRRHDFQLGRRNCQAFLKWHFALPMTNRLFEGEDRDLLYEWQVREPDHSIAYFPTDQGVRVPYVPIVPLVGSAAEEVKPLPAPSGKAIDRSALKKMVDKRVKAVGQALIKSDLSTVVGGFGRFVVEKAWSWNYAGKITKMAMEKIDKELARLP